MRVGFWIIPVWLGLVVLFFVILNARKSKYKDTVLENLATNRMFFVVTIVLCIMVVTSFAITNLAFTNQRHFEGEGEVRGVIRSMRINDEEGSGNIVLANVTFDGNSVRGRVRVNIWNIDENPLRLGQIVVTETTIRRTEPTPFNVNNHIRYTAAVNLNRGTIAVVGDSRDLRSVILRHTHDFFHTHMRGESAELLYSMLFGDRSSLDGELQETFRLSGMAHVLAVSGLHVGLIVAIVLGLLSLLRVKRKHQIIVVTMVLLFYMYLCDFRVSIVRASIMFFVIMLTGLYARRVDLISRVCLAWIIVLVIFPYQINSLSFQLSFGCMFGIAFFYRPFTHYLQRLWPETQIKPIAKFRKFSIDSLSLYTVTAITTFPFLIITFGFYSVIGLVTNILLLPFLIIAFQLSAIALLTVVGFPLLYLADVLVRFVAITSDWLARAPFAVINVTAAGYWYLFYFVGLILCTRFIFMRRRYRVAAVAVCFSIYFLSLVIYNT
ncbi:MAG: ComEC family competence protein [Firmicutes bacterium]|nr:ComEC family competence protein [Bacillota bacterium]